jgi:hypothetical protein
MHLDLEKKLKDAFPYMFRGLYGDMDKTCMHWGLECGDGWFQHIYDMCVDLDAVVNKDTFHFDQIKNKFGLLRVYYTGAGTEEAFDIVEQYENRSRHVCEECGKDAKLLSIKGWMTSRCKDHAGVL